VLLATLLALPVLGRAAEKPAKNRGLKGENAAMVKVLDLTADQQARIKEKEQTLAETLKTWDANNKERLDNLTTELKAAKQARDKAAIKKAGADLDAVKSERDALKKAGQKDILALLTPEQQQAWTLYRFQQGMLKRFTGAKLTDEQVAKVKELSANALKEFNALPDNEKKGRRKVNETLVKTIQEQVLTGEQREAMKAAPKAKQDKKRK